MVRKFSYLGPEGGISPVWRLSFEEAGGVKLDLDPYYVTETAPLYALSMSVMPGIE